MKSSISFLEALNFYEMMFNFYGIQFNFYEIMFNFDGIQFNFSLTDMCEHFNHPNFKYFLKIIECFLPIYCISLQSSSWPSFRVHTSSWAALPSAPSARCSVTSWPRFRPSSPWRWSPRPWSRKCSRRAASKHLETLKEIQIYVPSISWRNSLFLFLNNIKISFSQFKAKTKHLKPTQNQTHFDTIFCSSYFYIAPPSHSLPGPC